MLDRIPDEVKSQWRKDKEKHDKRMAAWDALTETEQRAMWNATTKALKAENHRRAMNKIMGRCDPYVPANDAEANAIMRVMALSVVEHDVLDPKRWYPDRSLAEGAPVLGSLLKSVYPAEHGVKHGWEEGDEDAAILETLRVTWGMMDDALREYDVDHLRGEGYLGLDQHRIDMLCAVSIGLASKHEPTWDKLWNRFVSERVMYPVSKIL